MVRPRFALLENVAALLGRGLDQVLGHMASFGYDAEWHCIPASAVGAPHRRDRIWIIATDAGGEQHEGDRPPISGEIAAELSRAAAYASPVFGPSFVGGEPNGDFAGCIEEREQAFQAVADAEYRRCEGRNEEWRWPGPVMSYGWWAAEPNVGRVADGVPARVDRLRTLGNAVVRFIPEIIGRTLMGTF
jgi:DNA (cytosine-5)-methyltransferase 1